jgi:hypothetical protein
MSLEMTPEQETRLANLLLACGSTRGCEATDADRVFALVRDMVLEAAAEACEGIASEALDLDRQDGVAPDSIRAHITNGYAHGALFSAEAVRAMKG